MKKIFKGLWTDPTYLGGVLTAAISLGTAFVLDWSAEQVAATTAFIAVLTGTAMGAKRVSETPKP